MRVYERLLAWQRCHELTLAIYRVTRGWPADERYGLTRQSRRAAASAAANIAEGVVRSRREYARFLGIAIGSLAELSYWIRLARDLGYLEPGDAGELEGLRARAAALTWRLYRRVSPPPRA
jgi:four helix bundle protein